MKKLSWKARTALVLTAAFCVAPQTWRHPELLQTPLGALDLAIGALFHFAVTYTLLALGALIWHGANYAVALIGHALKRGPDAVKNRLEDALQAGREAYRAKKAELARSDNRPATARPATARPATARPATARPATARPAAATRGSLPRPASISGRLLMAAVLAAVAVFVWPTPYRYSASGTVRFQRIPPLTFGRFSVYFDGCGGAQYLRVEPGGSRAWVPVPRANDYRIEDVPAHLAAVKPLLAEATAALQHAREVHARISHVDDWLPAAGAWKRAAALQEDLIRARGPYFWTEADHDAASDAWIEAADYIAQREDARRF